VTTETGIRRLVPAADIDDYVFEPCGYSMNGILGPGFMTIHITPEAGFSYASVEVAGFDPEAYDPADMTSRILAIFRPRTASVSLSVDVAPPSGEYGWGTLAARPAGYGCASATCQELASGGRVAYYTFNPLPAGGPAAKPPPTPAAAGSGALASPGRAASGGGGARLLRHMPSFNSLPSLDSDAEFTASGGSSSGDEGAEAGARLAAALSQLRRNSSRRGSGSLSPKGVTIVAPHELVPSAPGACAPAAGGPAAATPAARVAPACAACKGSGVAAAAVVAVNAAGSDSSDGAASPASPVSPVRLTA
jgi:hypothetical protein